jgi:hypothetical protein
MGRTGFGWLRMGLNGGNESSGSIKKAGYFLTWSVTISFST